MKNKIPRSGKERDKYIKKLNTMNEYDRLVENLCTLELGIRQLEAAYSESLRRNKNIPEGVWNILCNSFPEYTGTLHPLWDALNKIPAATELAYRRGIQEGKENI